MSLGKNQTPKRLPIRADLRSNFDKAAFYIELSEDNFGNYTISFFDPESGTEIDLTSEQTQSFFSVVAGLAEIHQNAENFVPKEDD